MPIVCICLWLFSRYSSRRGKGGSPPSWKYWPPGISLPKIHSHFLQIIKRVLHHQNHSIPSSLFRVPQTVLGTVSTGAEGRPATVTLKENSLPSSDLTPGKSLREYLQEPGWSSLKLFADMFTDRKTLLPLQGPLPKSADPERKNLQVIRKGVRSVALAAALTW